MLVRVSSHPGIRGTAVDALRYRFGMRRSHVGRLIGFAAVAMCGCAGNDLSLTGDVGQRSFVARDAFFDVGTQADADGASVTFTELRFTDYAGGCAWYEDPSVLPPLPNLEVAAALYTASATLPANGNLDSSVHTPTNFALASVSGAQAYGSWALTATNSGLQQSFDAGTIEITAATADSLVGSIDMTSTAGDHVSGTFTASLCAAADH